MKQSWLYLFVDAKRSFASKKHKMHLFLRFLLVKSHVLDDNKRLKLKYECKGKFLFEKMFFMLRKRTTTDLLYNACKWRLAQEKIGGLLKTTNLYKRLRARFLAAIGVTLGEEANTVARFGFLLRKLCAKGLVPGV